MIGSLSGMPLIIFLNYQDLRIFRKISASYFYITDYWKNQNDSDLFVFPAYLTVFFGTEYYI